MYATALTLETYCDQTAIGLQLVSSFSFSYPYPTNSIQHAFYHVVISFGNYFNDQPPDVNPP
jgi:hypothetical protein